MSADPVVFRTPEQVATRTGLSRKAIYRAIERGELVAYRLCGRLRIHPDDEHAWINHNRITPVEPARPSEPGQRPAPAQHSLRRLLQAQEKSTGLAATRSYDATPDSHEDASATPATPRGRHKEASP